MNTKLDLIENLKKTVFDYINIKLDQHLTHRVLQNFPPERGLRHG